MYYVSFGAALLWFLLVHFDINIIWKEKIKLLTLSQIYYYIQSGNMGYKDLQGKSNSILRKHLIYYMNHFQKHRSYGVHIQLCWYCI